MNNLACAIADLDLTLSLLILLCEDLSGLGCSSSVFELIEQESAPFLMASELSRIA